ncbi:V-type ATPase, 116 kDa subunit [Methanoregula boonei 6A8]|uniref:A-type ATP synthase subunit I n=1 Tax=Methanoregula boonei (strain DSM 21154 / JCM 14090 / 6A8) TaxID=456442 RepID=A7IAV3_METB6|nr:V-type ATP synthase subunit I [Methanoregula boonei]ABS56864.1 V-type ATPase, 116 kDa subunit [Methanoregula boonei 6A8]
MLAPKPMSRVLIVASRDQAEPIIGELYREHLFHIEDYVEQGREGYEGFKIGNPLPGATEASQELVKVRAIENVFSVRGEDIDAKQKLSAPEIRQKIEKDLPGIEKEVEDLAAARSKLDTKAKEYEQKIQELAPFRDTSLDLALLRNTAHFSVLAGYAPKDVVLSVPHEIETVVKGKDRVFVIAVVAAKDRAQAERELQEAQFQSVGIPEESGTATVRTAYYTEQITSLKKETEGVNAKLAQIRESHADLLVACEEAFRAKIEQTEAPLRFATTAKAFVAEGWVPADRTAGLFAALDKVTGGRVFVSEQPIDLAHDTVPVEYNNPEFAKPAQLLMDVYSRPTYTEVDPTLLLSIMFPIFFGVIVGDVGYGLLMLALCVGLWKFMKGDEARQFLKILRNASIMSIFFGLLFSEFLGFELPWAPIIYSRHLNIGVTEAGGQGAAIAQLLIVSVWVGILYVTLGRALGMVNHARQDHGDHRIKAVLANFGWITVMWGILIAIWSMFPIPLMPDLTGLPIVAVGLSVGMVVAIIFIVMGVIFIARDAVLEIIEIPTIISHVLSYTRLTAVGLSSVAIAMVVNYMSIGMFINPGMKDLSIVGIVMIVIGVLIFLLGHAFNLALGLLDGGLHSIRLHYVEFFTKFYKGGGRKYNPFGMKRKFTED